MKKFSATFAAAVVLFLSACNNKPASNPETTTATADTTTVSKPAPAPVKMVMIQHPVKDFEKWKAVYTAHDSVRKAYGITDLLLGRGLDNPNMVTIINKIADVQKAKEFAALPGLKEAMQKGGVTGAPTFSYIEVVRNDTSVVEQKERMLVKHRVKDFDAWLKVYDSEGKATRAANGCVDRGIGRDIDDPNTVYIVFAITDMAKAKARIASEELKKLMMSAGVEGAPQISFYRYSVAFSPFQDNPVI